MTRILVDATTAQHARGGIGVVTSGFLEGASPAVRQGMTVVAGPDVPVPVGYRVVRPPLLRKSAARMLFQRAGLPAFAALAAGRPRRVLLLDSYMPMATLPGVTRWECFVHDVLPLTHPQYFTARKDVLKRVAFNAIRRLRPRVFASSPFVASEIERELGIRPEIAEFGCGQFSDSQAAAFLDQPLEPKKPYLLYVGAIEARKDIATLVRAFEGARTTDPRAPSELHIIGNTETAEARAFRAWADRVAPRSVRFLGRRPAQETIGRLRDATALVYPSLAEGFGLPVLEGMAIGTPVITTDIPAIRSWAGEGASYFPAGDVNALAEAIRCVSATPLDQLTRAGQEISERYRWARFAEKLVA